MGKKRFAGLIACVLAMLMALSLAACGEPKVTTTVTLGETSLTIGVGDSKRISATVSDDSALSWSSSDEKVATVNSGVVKGVGAGEATITATANGVSATCKVTVESITVELDKTALTLDIERENEKTGTLVATVKKNGTAIEETVVWSSSDDSIVTVSGGVVTAVSEGTATVTAKRSSGSASASCEVTVGWKDKPAGYKKIDNYEQNKVPVNTWGYWNDQGNWVAGLVTAHDAYTADSANSEAGLAHFEFTTTSRDESQGDKVGSNYQIVYRSAGEGGKLDTNYKYTLTLDVTTNVAGEIQLNNERIDTAGAEGDAHKFDLTVGKNSLSVEFNHYDDGKIYDQGVYTNIASAIFLLPGKLGAIDEKVELTIDNVHWVKGAAVDPLPEPEKPEVKVPDLSGTAAIALDIANTDSKYAITDNGDKKSYTIAYTGVTGQTYENTVVDITGTSAATCNTFSVKIKNNGEKDMYIRFDLAGTEYNNGKNESSRECAISSVATGSEQPATDTTWDGTQLKVKAGEETVLYITYVTDGNHGVPTQLLIYTDTLYINGTDTFSGNVTISDFKFANVTPEE